MQSMIHNAYVKYEAYVIHMYEDKTCLMSRSGHIPLWLVITFIGSVV